MSEIDGQMLSVVRAMYRQASYVLNMYQSTISRYELGLMDAGLSRLSAAALSIQIAAADGLDAYAKQMHPESEMCVSIIPHLRGYYKRHTGTPDILFKGEDY